MWKQFNRLVLLLAVSAFFLTKIVQSGYQQHRFALVVLQNFHMEVHNNTLLKSVSWIYPSHVKMQRDFRGFKVTCLRLLWNGVQYYCYQEFERKWSVHTIGYCSKLKWHSE